MREPGARRVAVVGAGVAGLTAAHVLQRSCAVTLYEARPVLGGHADTHDVVASDGRVLAVDTGFIVHNRRTYPTLLRLFEELGVTTQESEMSMSVRCDGCGLEYAGARGPRGLLATPRALLDRRFPLLLTEILRFQRAARRVLAADGPDAVDRTFREFLAAGGFSRYFVQHFATPLVSCVWSCAPGTALRYPARHLFRFLDHHGLLRITGSPTWRTVVGGSRSYVERAAKSLTAVRTGVPVRSVRRVAGGVEVTDDAGESDRYDAAVVATHPGQALALLAEPTSDERRVLAAFAYSRNPTVLHTDTSLLPRSPRAAASWNYRLERCDAAPDSVLVSYDMNRLQRLGAPETFIVTLNPGDRIAADRIVDRMDYEHPIYTPESVTAQRELPALNDGVLAFAGAYHGWGFHEDGARSGVVAAASLGAHW